MVRGRARSISPARGAFLALAFLALAMRVMVPAGFMAAAPKNDLPFEIVLCTGHGPSVLESGRGLAGTQDQGPTPADKAHDSPCAFAGHGAAAVAPSALAASPAAFAAYAAVLPAAVAHLVPGRGLPAPPPPARGPPSLLI